MNIILFLLITWLLIVWIIPGILCVAGLAFSFLFCKRSVDSPSIGKFLRNYKGVDISDALERHKQTLNQNKSKD